MDEGVIQYALKHTTADLGPQEREAAARLLGWRTILLRLGLVGRVPGRYGGLGFGNLSARVAPPSAPRGRRRFVVTGSQTAGEVAVDAERFAVVDRWDWREHRLTSRGKVEPSSESMTHAMVYDLAPHVAAVFHVHSPALWTAADALGLPATPADVAYGTHAMAEAVRRLLATGRPIDRGLFVMRGHVDGVVAFGRTPDEAGRRLVSTLAEAVGRRFR